MDKLKEMKELIKKLNYASDMYYNGDKIIMTDASWDIELRKLQELEKETGVLLSNSPSQNVGYEVKDKLEKVQHPSKMLSLDKTKDIEQLKKFLGNKDGILSWKLDGLTIVLTYENGKLIDAVTRGNGEIGSRILHNAKVFKSGVPLTINYKGKLVIRGEGLISKDDFKDINSNGEYMNPRNLASGSIMQLDSKIAKQRQLQFKAFSIAECDEEFIIYSEQLQWLENQGFNVVEYLEVNKNNIENAIKNFFEKEITNYEFSTDGLVLMFNNLIYGESLGSTSHHNLNAIAFKWNDDIKETILRDIQFQVGRTGVLTPVAVFDDTELEGTIVNKASLHNLSILKQLELGIGDTVTCYKANMIIPQLNDNLTRSNTFKIPTQCPECGEDTEVKFTDNAEFLMCTNPNCKAKLVQNISHYCSRNAMNIMGISDAVISKFIEKGFIKTIVDLYNLEQFKKEIVKLEGFGLKSYTNAINSINSSKKCKLSNFLFALGIPNVGRGTAKDISAYFNNSIDNLTDAINCSFDFSSIKDIGDITNKSIYEWLQNKDNINLLEELINILEFEQEEKKINSNTDLSGLTFVITGSIETFKNRNEFGDFITSLNGKLAGSVSKATSYLINNDNTSQSSKNVKAQQLGVKIITESEFNKMVNRIV